MPTRNFDAFKPPKMPVGPIKTIMDVKDNSFTVSVFPLIGEGKPTTIIIKP